MKRRKPPAPACSFCGGQQDAARQRLLFVGPEDVAICSERVDLLANAARTEREVIEPK